MEGFRIIPEYPDYLVNEKGEIYSTKTSKILKGMLNNVGYKQVTFTFNNERVALLVHRIVARVFLNLPSLSNNLHVDHIDRDKTNNCISNLQVLSKEDHIIKTLEDKGHSTSKPIPKCKLCENAISSKNKSGKCKVCISKGIYNKDILLVDIIYWVTKHSWVRASKELGLSDNGLRKRYNLLTGKDPKKL